MSKMKNLKDLFEHEIQDLYSAENQLVEALPKMQKAAHDKELKKAFGDHLKETKKQVERLEKISKDLGFEVDGEKCKGMAGLIKEGEGMIDEDADDSVKDAGLIAAAQRVEHYEIAGYGVACQFAKRLGYDDALKLLKETIQEEKNADELLTEIAEASVNADAE